MARKPRIHYPDALYHVILRGNARQDTFFDDGDRYRFHLLMQEGIERYGHSIHAFCLMTNHLHLLIQVADVPLSRIMQNLSFRYTRWSNRRQGKSGHLFQGRYKAVLVNADEYLLELVRYLHLNPVRVGMTRDPLEFPWSSHRAYCGKENIPWLHTDLTLSAFGKRRDTARRKFLQFVLDGLDERHRPEFHRGIGADSRVLGDESFMEKVLVESEDVPVRRIGIDEIVSAVCRFYGAHNEELRGKTHRSARLRAMTAWIALETEGCTITELADKAGRDISTLSCAVRKLQAMAGKDPGLSEEYRMLMRNMRV
ncbi:MAG: transposase [Geobacteraceae bacterium]|nr:transposase [Geobacteraceae bacterium]